MIPTDECINVGRSQYFPDVPSFDILGVYGFVFTNSRINIVVFVIEGVRLTKILEFQEVFQSGTQ